MKIVVFAILSFLFLPEGIRKTKQVEFIVVVSDFSCKACHRDIISVYNSVSQESRIYLQVFYITHESLLINIRNHTGELAKTYNIRSDEIVVQKPEEFVQQFPLSQEHLSRSPFVLLKKKENTLVISQKDLTTDGGTERVVEEIKDFFK
ncbi:MAG: hypothetical protein ACOVQ5_09385 [Flavobacteriales bacterium]|jgi:hypothetical protein